MINFKSQNSSLIFSTWIKLLVITAIIIPWNSSYAQQDFNSYIQNEYFKVVPVTPTGNDDFNTEKDILPSDYQGLQERGLSRLNKGLWTEAIQDFDKIINRNSEYGQAYYFRGIAYNNLGNYEQAKRDFLKAIEHNSLLAEVRLELAVVYYNLFEYDKCEESLLFLTKAVPEDPTAYYYLGQLYAFKGDIEQARQYHLQALEKDKGFVPSLIELTRYDIQDERYIDAFITVDKALKIDSVNTEGYVLRGMLFLVRGQIHKARKDWEVLLELNPSEPYFHRLFGLLLIDLMEYNDAIKHFTTSFEFDRPDPNDYDGGQTAMSLIIDMNYGLRYLKENSWHIKTDMLSEINKAMCFILVNSFSDARQVLNKVINKMPDLALGYYLRGLVQEYTNNQYWALQDYDQAIKLDNELYDAYKKRGILRFEDKKFNGALMDFNKMLALDSTGYLAYIYKGNLKMTIKEYDGAISDFLKYMAKDSMSVLARKNLAFCYKQTNQFTPALNIYRETMVLPLDSSDYMKIRYRAALLSLQNKDTVEAEGYLDEILIMNAHYPAAYDLKGSILIHRFQWREALNVLNTGLIPESLYLPALLKRAKLFMLIGNYKLALKDINQFLALTYEFTEGLYFRGLIRREINDPIGAQDDIKNALYYGFNKKRSMKDPLNKMVIKRKKIR